jgi:hydrogenase expression/formation protein HypC
MCLAVPGQIVTISCDDDPLQRSGRVDFSGVSREISLAYVPEARVGDYVIVHAGFALSVLDEDEARASLAEFQALAEAGSDT